MLTFTPTYTLLNPGAAAEFLAFLCKLDAEAEYMHYQPGERTMTVQGMKSRLRKQEKQGNSFVVVALGLDGSIIGYFSVNGGNSIATRHSATVAVGVLRDYKRQGIASGLIMSACVRAFECGIRRFECTVVKENRAAVNFYSRLGFISCGLLTGRYFGQDGVLRNELVLEFHFGQEVLHS